MKIITSSEKETFAIAKEIGAKIKTGQVFALSGNLGAGKTVFARGFAKGLGVKRNVNSPTFVLMKIYPVYGNKKIKELCHIDAYRLKSAKDLEAIGALDYLKRKDVVTLIEWPERIKKFLPKKYIKVFIKNKSDKENKREIELK